MLHTKKQRLKHCIQQNAFAYLAHALKKDNARFFRYCHVILISWSSKQGPADNRKLWRPDKSCNSRRNAHDHGIVIAIRRFNTRLCSTELSSCQVAATTANMDLAVMILLAFTSVVSAAHATKPPNFLFVLADDFGHYDVGWRNPEVVSPTLDALASSGIILNRHYVYKFCSVSFIQSRHK